MFESPRSHITNTAAVTQTAFGHDYGCTRLQEVPYNHLLRVLPRAFTEVMRRIANPLRPLLPGLFKNGKKGEAHLG
jgi:hypothetical protein